MDFFMEVMQQFAIQLVSVDNSVLLKLAKLFVNHYAEMVLL
jgi:hypothetical protein